MRRCPKIGERVSVDASRTHGAFTGTVTKIYPEYVYDEQSERETSALLPEAQWHVCIAVDKVPEHWPYLGTNLIAPEVSALKRITGGG